MKEFQKRLAHKKNNKKNKKNKKNYIKHIGLRPLLVKVKVNTFFPCWFFVLDWDVALSWQMESLVLCHILHKDGLTKPGPALEFIIIWKSTSQKSF